jgi:2-hydroxycyclohexanecarboxyl-CoA dehydrogenase
MELSGQCAVVTGGASGIGRATVLALAKRGARVLVGDVDREGGEATCALVAGDGGEARFIPLDVTDDATIAAFQDDAAGDGPGVLVNAAGWDRAEPFLDNTLEFIERIVRINLLGCIKVTHALLPGMIESGSGRIVNVASDAGRVGSSGETVYAGAKGGVIAFTKSVARETARHGITANCVCPGPTDTPLFRSLPEKLQQGLIRSVPSRFVAWPFPRRSRRRSSSSRYRDRAT